MDNKENQKPLYQRITDANILGDGNLFNIKPSDIVIKTFEENIEEQIDEKEKPGDY